MDKVVLQQELTPDLDLDLDRLYKVHKHDRSTEYFENRSIFRFDPPEYRRDEFGTLYAATSAAGAFYETLGNIRPLPKHLVKERVLAELAMVHPFNIADLTSENAAFTYGRLFDIRDVKLAQDFTAALWDAGFTGVQYSPSYRSRPGEFAVALWAPPGLRDDLLKSIVEPIPESLLSEVKGRFDIDVIGSEPLP
jgi:hypothetical protein